MPLKPPFLSFILVLYLLASCQEQHPRTKEDTAAKVPASAAPARGVPEENPAVAEALRRDQANDRILATVREGALRHGNPQSLLPLDSLAAISDASLTTDVNNTTVQLFYQNFPLLLNYLYAHPGSALGEHLVAGLSAALAVYEGAERLEKIGELKAWGRTQCRKAAFSPAKMRFTDRLLNSVNPATYD